LRDAFSFFDVSYLTEVHDPADGRRGARVHLDQFEALLFGELEGVVGGHDADLGTVGPDDTDLRHTNATTDSVIFRRSGGRVKTWSWDTRSSVIAAESTAKGRY
jgi:hypothetical protein